MIEFNITTINSGASTEILRGKKSLDQEGITSWLFTKNIISRDETLLNFKDLIPWKRTGGETYSTLFEFTTDKQKKQIFIKALVTLLPEKSLLDWARRRDILFKNGIPVSRWYYHAEATIIEDFYPNTSDKVSFENILNIGYQLDKLGFAALKFVDDIRADENGNPFFIDFGFDLGEPSNSMSISARDYLLKNYPEKQYKIFQRYE